MGRLGRWGGGRWRGALRRHAGLYVWRRGARSCRPRGGSQPGWHGTCICVAGLPVCFATGHRDAEALRLCRRRPYAHVVVVHVQDFSNGYMFGQLFHSFNMQPDFAKFEAKKLPDAMINNFTRLQVRRRPARTRLPTCPLVWGPAEGPGAAGLTHRDPG